MVKKVSIDRKIAVIIFSHEFIGESIRSVDLRVEETFVISWLDLLKRCDLIIYLLQSINVKKRQSFEKDKLIKSQWN